VQQRRQVFHSGRNAAAAWFMVQPHLTDFVRFAAIRVVLLQTVCLVSCVSATQTSQESGGAQCSSRHK
jgi:hypothetical protein